MDETGVPSSGDGRMTHAEQAKAQDEITRIVERHRLGFTHNAGGGEFRCNASPEWRCQIGAQNDVADLARLRAAVALLPPETGT